MNQNISPEELILIDQYLNKELSSEDLLQFEKMQNEDPQWQAKINEIKLLRIGIAEAALRNQLNNWHQETVERNEDFSSKTKTIAWWKIAAVAAAIIVSVGSLFFYFQQNKPEKLYAEYYKPDPGLMTLMSSSDDYAFEKAMVDYKSGNYQKALDGWQKLKEKQVANDTLNYFLAMSHLGLEQYSTAFKLLQPITQKKESTFYKEANWYAGLIQVRENKFDKAIPYINTSEFKQSQQLIEALKKK